MQKELQGYILDPAAPIHPDDRAVLEDILTHNPDYPLISFTQNYFDGMYDFAAVQDFFLTPEQAEANAAVQATLKETFRQLVSPYVNGLPEEYVKEQAEAVTRLYQEFRMYEPSNAGNPFERLLPLRTLQKETGLKARQIEYALKDVVHMGDLSLQFYLHNPYNNPRMKKAIHDSVHYKQGRMILEERSIPGNLQRMRNERRTIGVYPAFTL